MDSQQTTTNLPHLSKREKLLKRLVENPELNRALDAIEAGGSGGELVVNLSNVMRLKRVSFRIGWDIKD
ncbi:MAG: hypothetical protein BGO39_05055 [Chloroflexi bacterium 54-19]|nr:MAG: hypothetical protein BGO39_05055 [Chloroflexi bacterium 54-19]